MARYEGTLKNLKQIAALMPAANAAVSMQGGSDVDFAKKLLAVLSKEDYTAVRIALLVKKLTTKYKGRAV